MSMIDAHLTFNCLCGCQKTYERMEFYQHQIQYGKKLSKEKILDHIFTSSDNQSLREFLNIPGGMSDGNISIVAFNLYCSLFFR
eukprot:Awhi_evm2s4473